jgi:hypothetical protein
MSYVITQSETETDLELFILGAEIPHFLIEVYVPTDRKYDLGEDYEDVQQLTMKLQKDFGVANTGSVSITLKNNNHRYSDNHASSIFNNKQIVKDWLRMRSGWGDRYRTDVRTIFQGKIKRLDTTERRQAKILAYDVWQDFLDESLAAALTVSSSLVSSMNPIDILEYLVDTYFALQWFDMDTLANATILDQTTLQAAKNVTGNITIEATTWDRGTKLSQMLQDLMKICGGYLYAGRDGKLYTYIYAPTTTAPSANTDFQGDETAATRHILKAVRYYDLSKIANVVNWTYGSSDTKRSSGADSTSQSNFGDRPLDLTTKWNCNPVDLDAMAQRYVDRYKGFPSKLASYEITMTWLNDGLALAVTLGDEIDITDSSINESDKAVQVYEIQANMAQQYGKFVCEEARTHAKFAFTCSDIDEGDGYGVTSGDFNNWQYRFAFAGDESTGFAGEVGTDAWGNDAEDIFIAW